MNKLAPDAIPADILAAAEDALDMLLCNCREAGDVRQDSIIDIARAILAERERCANVARHLNGWGADCGAGGHAEHIANVIINSHSLVPPIPADSPADSSSRLPGAHSVQS